MRLLSANLSAQLSFNSTDMMHHHSSDDLVHCVIGIYIKPIIEVDDI